MYEVIPSVALIEKDLNDTELETIGRKKKSELKNTITEIKSILEEINNRVDDREEWVSDLKRT